MSEIYKAKQVILSHDELEDAYVEVADGKFVGVYAELEPARDYVDLGAVTLAPGLFDLHIHGFLGHDVMDADPEGLAAIAEGLLSCGVTSWLPTTLTAPTEELNRVCQMVGEKAPQLRGAKVQGIFLEGPFFTEKYKGAQNPNYMLDPEIDQLKTWRKLSQGLVNRIGIAPEREGAVDFVKAAKALGVHVGMGHSNASYDQAKACYQAGADFFVHTYNGMSGLHHREPGMVGAALSLKEVYAELICDGYHVHPRAAQILVDQRGSQETLLVTDCMRAGGLAEGPSKLGEFEVIVKDGAARLKEGGNLAGSILELKTAVKHVVEWGLASLPEAVRMASYYPAKSLGLENLCGQIKAGMDADFILLDENLELQATYLKGECRYQA